MGSQGEQRLKMEEDYDGENGQEQTLEDGKQNKAKKKMVKLEPGGWFGG